MGEDSAEPGEFTDTNPPRGVEVFEGHVSTSTREVLKAVIHNQQMGSVDVFKVFLERWGLSQQGDNFYTNNLTNIEAHVQRGRILVKVVDSYFPAGDVVFEASVRSADLLLEAIEQLGVTLV